MPLDLQQIINSTKGLQLVSALARMAPPEAGRLLARLIADQMSARKGSPVVRAVRSNQWVARGGTLGGQALDQAVRDTFRQSARCIFDLYHNVQDPDAAGKLIVLDRTAERLVGRSEFEDCGLIVAGLHLSNFDLCLQWMCKQGMQAMVLTIPQPKGGRRLEFEKRLQAGMNLVPASLGALKTAIDHLQRGGMVVTGIDRPIEDPRERPTFFGRPAALPMHHILLASRAEVPLRIVVARLQADGRYHVSCSEPIELEHAPALPNAEKVLKIAEYFIRRAPEQWSVPLAVWPEAVEPAAQS